MNKEIISIFKRRLQRKKKECIKKFKENLSYDFGSSLTPKNIEAFVMEMETIIWHETLTRLKKESEKGYKGPRMHMLVLFENTKDEL